MDAAAAGPSTPVKKSSAWKWVLGGAIVLVVAFLALGASVSNGYEAAVLARVPAGGAPPTFSNVNRFKSGAVCGWVSSAAGRQRFIVGPNGEAFVEDGSLYGAQVFNLTSDKICR